MKPLPQHGTSDDGQPPSKEELWALLKTVLDPEVPVLNVVEMGIVRDVGIEGNDVEVKITPTYSGCPAMDVIERAILETLRQNGVAARVKTVFNPPWTTDWMTDNARRRLEEYGIAPPVGRSSESLDELRERLEKIPCPFCKSDDTRLTAEFGSTACKSMHYCDACQQPFEHFKCH